MTQKLNVRLVVSVVLDNRRPDGSLADENDVRTALALCERYDVHLFELLAIAKAGCHPDGRAVEWDERLAAIDELERLTGARPNGHGREAPVDDDYATVAEDLQEGAETGSRQARRDLHSRGLGDGAPLRRRPRRPRPLAGDIRQLLEEEAREAGWEPDQLLRPIAQGRLKADEQRRRDALALAVHSAREAGGRLDEIGSQIGDGISKQRVGDLARRGAELSESRLTLRSQPK